MKLTLISAVVLMLASAILGALKDHPAPTDARRVTLEDLRPLAGRRSDIVLQNGMIDYFPQSLRANRMILASSLETSVPIRVEGDSAFGAGCRQRRCGLLEAAWSIDARDGAATAMVMNYEFDPGVKPLRTRFYLYGPAGRPVSPALQRWGEARGLRGAPQRLP